MSDMEIIINNTADVEKYTALAEQLDRDGKKEEAYNCYSRLLQRMEEEWAKNNTAYGYHMSTFYEEGLGTEVNYERAREIYRTYLRLGDYDAYFYLGNSYFNPYKFDFYIGENPEFVESTLTKKQVDLPKAANYYIHALKLCEGLDQMRAKMRISEISDMIDIVQTSDRLPDTCAWALTGFFHENGWFLEKDLDKAIYYYEKAAAEGHRIAIDRLARITGTHRSGS